jgi:hypothetical protein
VGNQRPVLIDTGNMANNGAFTIIEPVEGQRVYLGTLYCQPVAGLAPSSVKFDLETTDGVGFGRYDLSLIGLPVNLYLPPLPPMFFDTSPLDLNMGVQIRNTSGGIQRIVGHVTYFYGT